MIKLKKTKIEGCYEVAREYFEDERGSFGRLFSDEYIDLEIKHINHSKTNIKGAIRGLHYQLEPYSEIKLVTCLRGSIFDVCVDMRKDSSTYGQHHSIILDSPLKSLIIPKGCAHGLQSLTNVSEIVYASSAYWNKDNERGVNPLDPSLSIKWPIDNVTLSDKDRANYDFKDH